MGCDAVRWQGCSRDFGQPAVRLRNDQRLQALVRPARETTLRARARKEEQRSQRAAARLNRVRSARTKLNLVLEAKKVSVYAILQITGERPGEICGLEPQARQQIVHFALVADYIGTAFGVDHGPVEYRWIHHLGLFRRSGLNKQLDQTVFQVGGQ